MKLYYAFHMTRSTWIWNQASCLSDPIFLFFSPVFCLESLLYVDIYQCNFLSTAPKRSVPGFSPHIIATNGEDNVKFEKMKKKDKE